MSFPGGSRLTLDLPNNSFMNDSSMNVSDSSLLPGIQIGGGVDPLNITNKFDQDAYNTPSIGASNRLGPKLQIRDEVPKINSGFFNFT